MCGWAVEVLFPLLYIASDQKFGEYDLFSFC